MLPQAPRLPSDHPRPTSVGPASELLGPLPATRSAPCSLSAAGAVQPFQGPPACPCDVARGPGASGLAGTDGSWAGHRLHLGCGDLAGSQAGQSWGSAESGERLEAKAGGHRPGPPCLCRAHLVTGTAFRLWQGRTASVPTSRGAVPGSWCPAEQETGCDPRWGRRPQPSLSEHKGRTRWCPPVGMTHRAPQAMQEGAARTVSWRPGLVPALGLDSWTQGPGTGPGALASGCGDV